MFDIDFLQGIITSALVGAVIGGAVSAIGTLVLLIRIY